MPRIQITLAGRPSAKYRFDLARKEIVIGRAAACDVVVACGSISQRHAVVLRVPGGYELRDAGSTNGVKVAGVRQERVALGDGARVGLGEAELAFSLDAAELAALAAEGVAKGRQGRAEPARGGKAGGGSGEESVGDAGGAEVEAAEGGADWRDQAAVMKRGHERARLRRVLLGSGVLMVAVVAGIEGMRLLRGPEEEPAVVAVPVADEPVAVVPREEEKPGPAAVEEPVAERPAEVVAEPVVEAPVPAAEPEVQPTEAERIAGEAGLALLGDEAGGEKARARDRDMLAQVVNAKAWDAYRTLLGKSIREALAKVSRGRGVDRFDPVWREPVLYQALLRWKTLGWFSEAEVAQVVQDRYSSPMWLWLLNRNEAMEELLLTLQPADDGGKVLRFLVDAWAMNEKQYEKYFPLALACAVVFDRPVAVPNRVGSTGADASGEVNALERYLWYVQKNEAGKLAAPVHHSTARDLVWVVCAPVTPSELDWALDKLHMNRKRWGNTYGMIEYLMERAVNGVNPYKEYSFEEILKHGGICGDQSYFCVNTARAQGIPAMVIGGETDSGGHAWAGLKVASDQWDTGTGRIGGASKGETSNPQTGETVTEQEILSWNHRSQQSALVTLAVWRHLWIADYFGSAGGLEDQIEAVKLANRAGQAFPATWKALYVLLERQTRMEGDPPEPSNLSEWKDFVAAMRREFRDNPRMADLASRAEDTYVFPYAEGDEARSALRQQRLRVEREAGEQKDLLATSLKREADLIHKQGGPEAKLAISRLYDRALRDYGDSVTGFKMMAEDYYGYMRGDPVLARKAARDIELAFKRVIETGSKDWFRANTESSIYQMICRYYREAGDETKALSLERRYETLLRRAKRGAL